MTGSPKAKQIFTICIFLFHFSDCTIADTSLRIGNTHTTHHLTYGEALYNVYQDKYFSAITNLMVEKERSAFTRQNDDSALLLGSLYLSYGLHKSASIIFEKLTRENTEASTYDLAWFYLGKLRYITGDLAGSLSAFTKPENTLPTSIKAERDYYIVNILLNNGNYNEAIDAVERLKGDEIWHRYAFYNLGIALIRTSRDDEGIFHLNKIQTNDTNNEEESALSDKANVAKGYASLRRNHMADSTEYFSHSRLKGPYSNSALLGLGWAYSKQNKVQEALSPWLELSRRKSRDSAYHEVLLAIPKALEKLGAEEAALSHYQNAENIFNESLLELSEAKLSFTKIDNSFQYKAKQNNGNYNLFSINTIEDTKYHKYFSELISSPLFQTAYKKHLELHQLLIHIRDWKNKIPIIKTMLNERRRQYSANLKKIDHFDYKSALIRLLDQRDNLAVMVENIEITEDKNKLLTKREHDIKNRLAEIDTDIEKLKSNEQDTSNEARRSRILNGTIIWNVVTEHPERIWILKNKLREIDYTAEMTKSANLSLSNTLSTTPLNFSELDQQISGIESQIQILLLKIHTSLSIQQNYLSELVNRTIDENIRRLEEYKIRALFAQARLQDKLNHPPFKP